MTLKEVKKLHTGDEVFWEDPDDGLTSRNITIQSVKVQGEVVCISGKDGDELECYAHELS
ncbi:MAG: hypothetical protein J7L15_00900 [Clostridiales bacterium]|nr:hypothetical protein [Clostridiales bacterium]